MNNILDLTKKKFTIIKNTVLQISPLEQKVRDVTSADSWALVKRQDKQEIAEATYSFEEFKVVMGVVWKRISDAKNPKSVSMTLLLLEYLLLCGSERVIDDSRAQDYSIKSLLQYRAFDDNGRDQGKKIRDAADRVLELMSDEKKLSVKRDEARKNEDKYRGISRQEAKYTNYRVSSKPESSTYNESESNHEDYTNGGGDDYTYEPEYTSKVEHSYTTTTNNNNNNTTTSEEKKVSNIKIKSKSPRSNSGVDNTLNTEVSSGGRIRRPSGDSKSLTQPKKPSQQQQEVNLISMDEIFSQPVTQQINVNNKNNTYNYNNTITTNNNKQEMWEPEFPSGTDSPSQTPQELFPDEEFTDFQKGDDKKSGLIDFTKTLVNIENLTIEEKKKSSNEQMTKTQNGRKVTLNSMKTDGSKPIPKPNLPPTNFPPPTTTNYPPITNYPPTSYPPTTYPPTYLPPTYPPSNFPPQRLPPTNYPPTQYPPRYPPTAYPPTTYPPNTNTPFGNLYQ